MCIMDDTGKVYSCGKAGFCGHGESNDVMVPMWLDYFDSEEVEQVSISSGGFHTLALTKSGTLYSWGHCRVGQLGITMKEGMPRSEDGGYYLPVPHIVHENIPKNISKVRL